MKKFISGASALVLVMAGLVGATAPAYAASTTEASVLTVARSTDGSGNFTMDAGEAFRVGINVDFDVSTLVAGDILEITATGTGFTFTPTTSWYVNNMPSNVTTTTYTVPNPVPTVLSLSLFERSQHTNLAQTSYQITSSATKNGSAYSPNSVSKVVYANFSNASTYTAKVGDISLDAIAFMCVDPTLIVAGDSLASSGAIFADGTNASATNNMNMWMNAYRSGSSIAGMMNATATVPTPEPAELLLQKYMTKSSPVAGKVYTFSFDVTKGGTSVRMACPTVNNSQNNAPQNNVVAAPSAPANPVATVPDFKPISMKPNTGLAQVIEGSGFKDLKKITIGGKPAKVLVHNDTLIEFELPLGLKRGSKNDIVITDETGETTISNAVVVASNFTAKTIETPSFSGNSRTLTSGIKAGIKKSLRSNSLAETVTCVAYKSAGVSQETASARAKAACEYVQSVNPYVATVTKVSTGTSKKIVLKLK